MRTTIEEALAAEVTLRRLEILELRVPQVESFRSAIGVRHERRALFVRWWDAGGAWGIGECSCRPDPYFSGEFVDGAVAVLRDHLFPQLPRHSTLGRIAEVTARVRGWPFTTAALLDAVCDLERRHGRADLLSRWDGAVVERVPVGISLGLFDEPAAAVKRVAQALDEGYRRLKLKIAPTMNRDTLTAIRKAFPDVYLGLDANGSFRRHDLAFLRSLAELRPAMIEQPFGPTRFDLLLALREEAPDLKICLDESITGLGTLRTAHRLGVIDELNLKPGRVGGPVGTWEVLAWCREHAMPAWVGGMFETSLGRLANLRVAARLPDARAHDLSPSRRYFKEDVVRRPVTMDTEGCVDLSDDSPMELDDEVFERLTTSRIVLEP